MSHALNRNFHTFEENVGGEGDGWATNQLYAINIVSFVYKRYVFFQFQWFQEIFAFLRS